MLQLPRVGMDDPRLLKRSIPRLDCCYCCLSLVVGWCCMFVVEWWIVVFEKVGCWHRCVVCCMVRKKGDVTSVTVPKNDICNRT